MNWWEEDRCILYTARYSWACIKYARVQFVHSARLQKSHPGARRRRGEGRTLGSSAFGKDLGLL